MQLVAAGSQKAVGMGRPLMWPLVFDTSAWREVQGREIRRNFSKTYAGLLLLVTIRTVNGQMVGFQTVTFQKPTISLKNIRLTCGDAGI